MRVLVYGVSGLLGREFFRNLESNKPSFEYTYSNSDITNNIELIDVFSKYKRLNIMPDLIINFAGKIDYSLNNAAGVFDVNVNGVLNLLAFDVPVITIGSIAALEPENNIYALSKYTLLKITKLYSNLFIINIPSVFSVSRKDGAIYDFYKKSKNHEDIIINCDLKYWNCIFDMSIIEYLVNIDNLKNIINGHEQIYNLGYATWHTMYDVARLIKEYMNSGSKIYIMKQPSKFSMECIDNGKFISPPKLGGFNDIEGDICNYVDLCNR